MTKTKNDKVEYWSVTDPRLPAEVDRPKDEGYRKTRDSIKAAGRVINPITVGVFKEKYHLVAGRARLMAVRELEWKEIPVITVHLQSMEELSILRVVENYGRSRNIIADFLNMKKMLFKSKSYKEVAESVGMTEHDVKVLDEKFGVVPDVFMKAGVHGKISVGTLVLIGRLTKSKQTKLEKILAENGKVTAKNIHDIRSAEKVVATQGLDFLNTVESPKRTTFTLSELDIILKAARQEKAVETIKVIETLKRAK